jgi:hypothetical protein
MATEEDRFSYVRQAAFVKAYDTLVEVAQTDLIEDILRAAHNIVDAKTRMPLYDKLVGFNCFISVEHALALLHGKTLTFPRWPNESPSIEVVPESLPGHAFISLRTYDKLVEVAEICGCERAAPWRTAVEMQARMREGAEKRAQQYAEERAAEEAD